MVRPAAFGANPQTAASNRFQAQGDVSLDARTLGDVDRELSLLVSALEGHGVEVCLVDDTPQPVKPDAIFPNNWVSFHSDGTAVLYPMLATNRRTERRLDILEHLARQRGFRITRTVDLSKHERDGVYLEGTGSLVLDRVHRNAFACLSPRTHVEALGDFAQQLDYEVVGFEASDAAGTPIYHTNVLMCVGSAFAVVCAEAIDDATRRAAVLRILESTGHEIVAISRRQMSAFAGNMLELRGTGGQPLIAMSASARDSLDAAQVERLSAHGRLVAVAIPTIERFGGGSVRCMLAEIHLPRRER
jgi:hypothetical protein